MLSSKKNKTNFKRKCKFIGSELGVYCIILSFPKIISIKFPNFWRKTKVSLLCKTVLDKKPKMIKKNCVKNSKILIFDLFVLDLSCISLLVIFGYNWLNWFLFNAYKDTYCTFSLFCINQKEASVCLILSLFLFNNNKQQWPQKIYVLSFHWAQKFTQYLLAHQILWIKNWRDYHSTWNVKNSTSIKTFYVNPMFFYV